jgi:hypothetical protein
MFSSVIKVCTTILHSQRYWKKMAWMIPNIFKTNYRWMIFVTGGSRSFDIKLHAVCSINRLNVICFKTGDSSLFNNHCLLHAIFTNVAYVNLQSTASNSSQS